MEESITLLTKIKEAFACEGQDVRAYSPLTLAYIGDGIYELVIRSVWWRELTVPPMICIKRRHVM